MIIRSNKDMNNMDRTQKMDNDQAHCNKMILLKDETELLWTS